MSSLIVSHDLHIMMLEVAVEKVILHENQHLTVCFIPKKKNQNVEKKISPKKKKQKLFFPLYFYTILHYPLN